MNHGERLATIQDAEHVIDIYEDGVIIFHRLVVVEEEDVPLAVEIGIYNVWDLTL